MMPSDLPAPDRRSAMELLAPAGGREALFAAVECGADAVYLGAKGFNARRSADNFDQIGLSEAVEYCHLRGVRVHVTLNTLVRSDEMEALYRQIEEIARANADAVIVQDLGVAEAVRSIAPGLCLHASTQMAVHNRQGVDFLAQSGFSRAVLAREMSLEEIRSCAGRGVELEVFCHGALCVSCSGQCLFSSLVGARSGNRGMCAQPCRLRYRLGNAEGFLLSPKDLMLLEHLGALEAAGVSSLKIEGRLKRPEYVAVVTDVYRRALDGGNISPDDREALLQIFNRGGFTDGYLRGLRDGEFLSTERPNPMGVRVGQGLRGSVRLDREVESADALALRRPGEEDLPVSLRGASGEIVPCPEARPGDTLWRLTSRRQLAQARLCLEHPRRQVPVRARLTCKIGRPAELAVFQGEASFSAMGEIVSRAEKHPLDLLRCEEQLMKTGGTPYRMEAVEIDADAWAFLPLSQINALRRDALDGLSEIRLRRYRQPVFPEAAPSLAWAEPRCAQTPILIARSGDAEQLLAALEAGAEEIVFQPWDLRPAALESALRILEGHPFALALPQVASEKTLDTLFSWARLHRDRIVATYLSNVAHLSMDWPGERRGDYGLNLTNSLAVEQAKLRRYLPSLELTSRQIAALPGEKELWVYGRVPLMQLRHCPLRAQRGDAGPHASCRFCDQAAPEETCDRQVLLDRRNARFPLRRIASEEGCVVQVLNSVAHFCLRRQLCPSRAWQISFCPDEDVRALTRLHRTALDGDDFRALPEWRDLENIAFTTGHYFRGVE